MRSGDPEVGRAPVRRPAGTVSPQAETIPIELGTVPIEAGTILPRVGTVPIEVGTIPPWVGTVRIQAGADSTGPLTRSRRDNAMRGCTRSASV